jgi:hypothetical protein
MLLIEYINIYLKNVKFDHIYSHNNIYYTQTI